MMSRIPRVEENDLPKSYDIIKQKRELLPDEVDSSFWNRQPTVQNFSNNRELGWTHVTANTMLWTETGLSRAETECVILTIARELESAYEWHDNVIAAIRYAGMSEEEILAIYHGDADALDDEHATLMRYTEEYVRKHGAVCDETHDAVATRYEESTVVGLVMLAGFYVSLSYQIEAIDLRLKDEFVGWELENYK